MVPAAVFKRILVFAVALLLAAQTLPPEERAIRLAAQIRVSMLEAGLPKQTLVQWLTRAAGGGARIHWDVTDCGEYSGDPSIDRGREFPLCVDAIADLPGSRTAIISVVMGSFQKGIAGRPQLLSVVIGMNGSFDRITRLRDLPARMKVPLRPTAGR